jgi:uncharacterized repeat protein (TIGR03803 family)
LRGLPDDLQRFGGWIRADNGDLYGIGYDNDASSGSFFRLRPASGDFTRFYRFKGFPFGAAPQGTAPLVQASDRRLYWVTPAAGPCPPACPELFRSTLDGDVERIHEFGEHEGLGITELIEGRDRRLYGVASGGGRYSRGTLFRFDRGTGVFDVLHSFSGGGDGGQPVNLIEGPDGFFLFGVTARGGNQNLGVAFRSDPVGRMTVLRHLDWATGYEPVGPLAIGNGVAVHGVMSKGGDPNGGGTLFKMNTWDTPHPWPPALTLPPTIPAPLPSDSSGSTTPTPPPPEHPAEPTPPAPPTSYSEIWGVVNPEALGTCSADVHDQYVVDVGRPVRFRTWHPQVDPSGCVFAHEHGDDPARMTNAEISAEPVAFGVIGYVRGDEEPHEGFKVFIALPGDTNDESRRNRVFSRSVIHMSTGDAARFTTRFHAADIRLIHPDLGLKAFTQLMMNTGGLGVVCDPGLSAPVKAVVTLQSPCGPGAFYEFWSTARDVMYQGRRVYRALAMPAVFDPITVYNPANPGETVYAWDSRLNSLASPNSDRTSFRGCDRESYVLPGYWSNRDTGRTVFYTDAFGNEVLASDPAALRQEISASESIDAPATDDGLTAFRMRVDSCSPGLGWRN